MEIKLLGLNNGKYSLSKDELFFEVDTAMTNNTTERQLLTIDKKSALEITHTLLDSLNLLDKDTEELLYEIEERIENER